MQSKRILVTGATSGIGREAAKLLIEQGHTVFATGRRETELESLAREADSQNLIIYPLDVTSDESIELLRMKIEAETSEYGLDVVINNAGYGLSGALEMLTREQLAHQFDVNVFGMAMCSNAFLPKMRERGSGTIINISSIVGKISLPYQGAYCASKFAVEGYSDALRLEVGQFGIKVVLIEPGMIRTEFEDHAVHSVDFSKQGPYEEKARSYFESGAKMFKQAPPASVVAKTIAKAVSARKPKRRYVTPASQNLPLIWMKKFFPAAWLDAMFKSVMKL
jgi:short-subunit dehydrogenase